MGGFAHLPRCRALRLVTTVAVVWLGLVAIPRARAADAVLVGAGDIAGCQTAADAATAALVAATPGTVVTLGDNAYQSGTVRQYAACYGTTWGRFKGRTQIGRASCRERV